ncbi:MAG TPA: YkoF family thiamine/hydroxymethylpyrimidine-binding protein [Sporosarcina sp.]|nr:YkoF family thiamine/hydroxymethylpyrimidine-binding protein [Sporosarcina sp.]
MNTSCANSPITTASFSLHPMCDHFIDIIKGALQETDTSNVWMKTDDVTTTVRGKMVHVFDVTKAICGHAASSNQHIAFQATYSIGCPGSKDVEGMMVDNHTKVNELPEDIQKTYAAAKFSLYPLGTGHYMDVIGKQIEEIKQFVTVRSAYTATKLEGQLGDIFHGLEKCFQATVDAGSEHTVMTVTLSIHSPSHQ